MTEPLSDDELSSLFVNPSQSNKTNDFSSLLNKAKLEKQDIFLAFKKELNRRENRGQKLTIQFLEKKITKSEFDIINEKEYLGFGKWWSSEAGWILNEIKSFSIQNNKNGTRIIKAEGLMSYESGHVVYGESEIITQPAQLEIILDTKYFVKRFSLEWM